MNKTHLISLIAFLSGLFPTAEADAARCRNSIEGNEDMTFVYVADDGKEVPVLKLNCGKFTPVLSVTSTKASWQKGAIENANKLIRQYIPKGTDFSTLTDDFIRKIQYKINRRPRKKLNFESPKKVFFDQIANFAVAS